MLSHGLLLITIILFLKKMLFSICSTQSNGPVFGEANPGSPFYPPCFHPRAAGATESLPYLPVAIQFRGNFFPQVK